MRLRHKKWAQPELNSCPFFIGNPQEYRGKWNTAFAHSDLPAELELGCGMGDFLAALSHENLSTNYLGVDIKSDVLGVAKRRIEQKFYGISPSNVLLTTFDINRSALFFSEEDRFRKIYINFCNPWPKSSHQKRRLTHPLQLQVYRKILQDDGMLFFRTDNLPLFEDSIVYLNKSGFLVDSVHHYSASEFQDRPYRLPGTRYEQSFLKQGMPIYWLFATKFGG